MTLPSQNDQELDQTCNGVTAGGVLTFTFPPVPQSLAWTGTICFTPTVQSIRTPQKSFYWDTLNQSTWILYRNGQPWLWWKGIKEITDIRATSTDVITVEAHLPSLVLAPLLDTFQARWQGQSTPVQDSEFSWPKLSEANPGPVPVYLANFTPSDPLIVLPYPLPDTIQVAQTDNRFNPPTASSQVLLAAGGTPNYLWGLSLHASAASLSTVTGAQSWRVQVATTLGGIVLAVINLDSIPGSTSQDSIVLDMRGFEIPGGDGLTVSWGAFGGTLGAFSATAVYDANNGNPG